MNSLYDVKFDLGNGGVMTIGVDADSEDSAIQKAKGFCCLGKPPVSVTAKLRETDTHVSITKDKS